MCSSRRSGRIARRDRWVMSVPRRRIVPAVGSTRRRMHFAIVDLPLPDSPTSPSISPWPSVERDAVDRVHDRAAAGDARADAVVLDEVDDLERGHRRRRHPGPGWKQATRCPPPTLASSGSCVAHSAAARGQRSTNEHPAGSSRSGRTRPGISRRRAVVASPRDGAEQRDRVRVLRRGEQLGGRRLLGLATRVEDEHAVGDVGDDAEVVGDEHDRGPEPLADLAHQPEDAGLRRHVERGRRLVGDQQLRVARERHRDHHALPHPARELVRVLVEPPLGRRDVHEPQQLDRPRARLSPRHAEVLPQHLADLPLDGEHRVERRRRLLEDERDLAAADAAELAAREREQVAAVEQRAAADHRGVRQQAQQ